MSEGGAAPPPQVFVVDSQASYVSMPGSKKSSWATAGQRFLLLLLGLAVLGVFVEGYLIYILYQRTEPLSRCGTNPPCHNSSHPLMLEQQNGRMSSQIKTKESNEILPIAPPERPIRPFAHVFGDGPLRDNEVRWNPVEQDIKNMGFNNSGLIILEEGYYYVYSRVEIDFSNETTNKGVFHKIMRNTSGYGKPIELLHSKSTCCQYRSSANSDAEELRSSFLAGIFHLQEGDHIYVTLSRIKQLSQGSSLGAFRIDH
ncbi:tumor necrosis factor ligand superfamily member 14 [Cyprinodon tularosa]|uniref:tumor necrosis factor ligand superfamily member 14 n=1 Tax=Cyprinodon tularosa TaxID=77115 RepID=UPI0018E21E85|nr:tumor necrosis factor ligand superfamily member 14 [Cyprinodon tularosa]